MTSRLSSVTRTAPRCGRADSRARNRRADRGLSDRAAARQQRPYTRRGPEDRHGPAGRAARVMLAAIATIGSDHARPGGAADCPRRRPGHLGRSAEYRRAAVRSIGGHRRLGTFAAIALIFDSPPSPRSSSLRPRDRRSTTAHCACPRPARRRHRCARVDRPGSWTGLNTSDYALGTLDLPTFARPDVGDFGWTIALAVACAVGVFLVLRLGREAEGILERRPFILLPAAGVAIAGLAIAFSEAADKVCRPGPVLGRTRLGRWWPTRPPGLPPHSRW